MNILILMEIHNSYLVLGVFQNRPHLGIPRTSTDVSLTILYVYDI